MLFNSVEFLVFYLVVVAAYFALPGRWRWVLLLAASYWFYMSWRAEYALLILATTAMNFASGIALERAATERMRRLWLGVGIGSSLSLLFAFKYVDFASESLQTALRAVSLDVDLPVFQILLPVGISFYTFQAVGYTIDVYRGRVTAERHFGIFALYVSFFPQLVAGPIERSTNLLPQFHEARRVVPEDVVLGLRAIVWGLLKKVVIADQLAVAVDTVYASPDAYAGPYLLLATVLFSIQIYCDFSGYSDMAIGTARIMGYRLMENFRRPYFSRSIGEFWRRWHISLMSWFRDYVYVALGGFQTSRWRAMRGVLIVFLLSGAWHGASWNFVVWGAIHGLASVASTASQGLRRALVRVTRIGRAPALHVAVQRGTMLAIVVLAFVFFRAQTFDEAIGIFARIAAWEPASLATLWSLGLPRFEMMVALGASGALIGIEWLQERDFSWANALWERRDFRWTCYAAEFWAIVFLGVFGRVEFIYFQF